MQNNNERNNDNGRGMFYAIIGVATLVITIIGATFAYLVASTNSAINAVTASGATVTLGYCDVITGINTNLIPIDPSLDGFNKGGFDAETDSVSNDPTKNDYQFVGIDDVDCKDINGNNICSVYQFTVTNTSTTSTQRVYTTLNPNVNTFTNLKFALFKGTADQVEKSSVGWDVDGTAKTAFMSDFTVPTGKMSCRGDSGSTTEVSHSFLNTTNATDASRKNVIANRGDLVISKTALTKSSTTAIDLDPCEQVLDIGESMTYTIVLWVDETYASQDDQGKNFAATLKFTSEDKSGQKHTGVTGVLTVTS